MYFTRCVKGILAAIAVSLLLFSPVSANENIPKITISAEKASKITEDKIRKILDDIKTATNNKNAEEVIKFLSDNASIEVTVQSPSGAQTLRFNRNEYRRYLIQGLSMMDNYNSSYSNIKINISPDGNRATATFNFTERVGFQGQTIQSTSSETVKFELIRGQILATSIKAVSSFE